MNQHSPERTPEDQQGSAEDSINSNSPELIAQVENFDALLASQQTALKDLLQSPDVNEEDDDLADELQELAWSEELLRRELTGVQGVQTQTNMGSAASTPSQQSKTVTPQRTPRTVPPAVVANAPTIPDPETGSSTAPQTPVNLSGKAETALSNIPAGPSGQVIAEPQADETGGVTSKGLPVVPDNDRCLPEVSRMLPVKTSPQESGSLKPSPPTARQSDPGETPPFNPGSTGSKRDNSVSLAIGDEIMLSQSPRRTLFPADTVVASPDTGATDSAQVISNEGAEPVPVAIADDTSGQQITSNILRAERIDSEQVPMVIDEADTADDVGLSPAATADVVKNEQAIANDSAPMEIDDNVQTEPVETDAALVDHRDAPKDVPEDSGDHVLLASSAGSADDSRDDTSKPMVTASVALEAISSENVDSVPSETAHQTLPVATTDETVNQQQSPSAPLLRAENASSTAATPLPADTSAGNDADLLDNIGDQVKDENSIGNSWDDGENNLERIKGGETLTGTTGGNAKSERNDEEIPTAVGTKKRGESWEEFGPEWTEAEEISNPPPGQSSMELDFFTEPKTIEEVDPVFSPRLEGRITPASETSSNPPGLRDIIMSDSDLIDTRMLEAEEEDDIEEDILGDLLQTSMRQNSSQDDAAMELTETPLRSNRTAVLVDVVAAAPMIPAASPVKSPPEISSDLAKSSSSEAADKEVSEWTGVIPTEAESPGRNRSVETGVSAEGSGGSKSSEARSTLASMLQSSFVVPPEDSELCDSSIGSNDAFGSSSDDSSALDQLPPQYRGDFNPNEASTPRTKTSASKKDASPIESLTIVTGSFENEPSGAGGTEIGGDGSLPQRLSPASSTASKNAENTVSIAATSAQSLLKEEDEYPEFEYYRSTARTEGGGEASPGRSLKSGISSDGNVSFATAVEGRSLAASGRGSPSRSTKSGVSSEGNFSYVTAKDGRSIGTADSASYVTAVQSKGTATTGNRTSAPANEQECEPEIRFTYSDENLLGTLKEASTPGSEALDSSGISSDPDLRGDLKDAPTSTAGVSDSPQISADPENGTSTTILPLTSPGNESGSSGYKQLSDDEFSQSDVLEIERKRRRKHYLIAALTIMLMCGIAIVIPFSLDATESDRSIIVDEMNSTEIPSTSPSFAPSLRSRLPLSTSSPSQSPSYSPATTTSLPPSMAPNTGTPSGTLTLAPSNSPSDQTLFSLLEERSLDGGASLRNETSPQFEAYTWLKGNSKLGDYSDDKIVQRYVLATLYYSTDGDGWTQNESWLTDEDECFWFSLNKRTLCDRSGRADELNLAYNDFSGTLPQELGLLSDSLKSLDFNGGPSKKLVGSIPSEFGLLTNLVRLRLTENALSGSIPTQLGNAEKLELLALNSNELTGPIPSEIRRLVDMKNLNLAENMLTGTISSSIGNLRGMSTLLLTDNRLEGPLPTSIGRLNRLRTMTIGMNRLTRIPTEIGLLDSLVFLYLEGNEIVGTLPTEFGNMKALRYVSVASNALQGSIPSELGTLRLLNELDLSQNQFSGSIPAEIGLIDGRMRVLKLNGNRLNGLVPDSFSKLNKVNTVMLQDNDLTGAMPVDVCAVFEKILPAVHIDCEEVDCACCNFCCEDNDGSDECSCRFLGTDMEWMCY